MVEIEIKPMKFIFTMILFLLNLDELNAQNNQYINLSFEGKNKADLHLILQPICNKQSNLFILSLVCLVQLRSYALLINTDDLKSEKKDKAQSTL